MQNSKQEMAKSAQLSEKIRVFGNPHPATIPVCHMLAIEDLFRVRVQQVLYYDRLFIDSVLYHTDTNTRLQKRNNSVVELADGTLCKIRSIVAFNPEGCNAQMSCVLVKKTALLGFIP